MAVVVLALVGKAAWGAVGAFIGPLIGGTVEMQARPEAPDRSDGTTDDPQPVTSRPDDT